MEIIFLLYFIARNVGKTKNDENISHVELQTERVFRSLFIEIYYKVNTSGANFIIKYLALFICVFILEFYKILLLIFTFISTFFLLFIVKRNHGDDCRDTYLSIIFASPVHVSCCACLLKVLNEINSKTLAS